MLALQVLAALVLFVGSAVVLRLLWLADRNPPADGVAPSRRRERKPVALDRAA